MPREDAVVIQGDLVAMSRESFRLMQDELARAVRERQVAIDRMSGSPYVDCICDGCPRKVPQAWASGACGPCSTEDCEHTDGAKEVAAERDELATRLDVVTKERDEKRADAAMWNVRAAELKVERDRLLAALEDCEPDHITAVAAIRARAGLAVKP